MLKKSLVLSILESLDIPDGIIYHAHIDEYDYRLRQEERVYVQLAKRVMQCCDSEEATNPPWEHVVEGQVRDVADARCRHCGEVGIQWDMSLTELVLGDTAEETKSQLVDMVHRFGAQVELNQFSSRHARVQELGTEAKIAAAHYRDRKKQIMDSHPMGEHGALLEGVVCDISTGSELQPGIYAENGYLYNWDWDPADFGNEPQDTILVKVRLD